MNSPVHQQRTSRPAQLVARSLHDDSRQAATPALPGSGAPGPGLAPHARGIVRVPPKRLIAIVAAVAAHHGCKLSDLLSPCRRRNFAWPRQDAMLACRRLTRASLPQIGEAMGRHHSTVHTGVAAATARPGADDMLAAVARAIGRADLAGGP